MFPPKKDDGGGDPNKKPAPKGGPPGGKPGGPPAPGAGLHQSLMQPSVKPGQGMDPMAAMMGGMGDMSQMGPPPPPAPGAPMDPGGMPIGGGLPSGDPGMDPNMEGSGLFQALHQSLDPYASGPEGHGQLDPPMPGGGMGLDQLLQILALSRAGGGAMGGPDGGGGMGGPPAGGLGAALNPSGQGNDMAYPGMMMGMQNQNFMM